MLQAVKPLSFKTVAILPLMHAVACGFRLMPLANIAITKYSLPDALTFLQTGGPLTLVYLAIRPSVDALAMRLSIQELTFISVTVGVAFHSSSIARIILPLAFVDASFAVLHNAEAFSFPIF